MGPLSERERYWQYSTAMAQLFFAALNVQKWVETFKVKDENKLIFIGPTLKSVLKKRFAKSTRNPDPPVTSTTIWFLLCLWRSYCKLWEACRLKGTVANGITGHDEEMRLIKFTNVPWWWTQCSASYILQSKTSCLWENITASRSPNIYLHTSLLGRTKQEVNTTSKC